MLAAQRKHGSDLAGYWQFPGRKLLQQLLTSAEAGTDEVEPDGYTFLF